MSTKKNLSAKDLSEKFGVPVSEKDLNTEDGAASRGLNHLGDLSELNRKENFSANAPRNPVPESSPVDKENEPEKSFAELFEARGGVIASNESAKEKENPPKRTLKSFVKEEETDFGKLFSLSQAKVVDKDSIALTDEESEPFEISEEDFSGKTAFHGFQDLPGERSEKRRH